MSEMIERVAKAILQGRFPADDVDINPYWPDDIASIVNGPPFEADGYRVLARVAIEAMREPTEAMMEAGDADIYEAACTMWPAMIDAALK